MLFFLRASIASAVLLVLAGCGVTGDELDQAATSTTSSTTTEPDESSTTTEPESTTTTEEEGPFDDNDPELEALLLTEEDFGVELEIDPDSDPGFDDPEFCEGQSFTVLPIAQASIGFETADLDSLVSEAIIEFGFEDDASLFLEELQTLNEACKATDDDDSIPATFEPIEDLGDEAIRALPDPGSEGLEAIVVRADERIILLAAFGEPILDNPLIIEAVDRAAP